MSTQVLGGPKGSRAIVGIVALTLTLAAFLLTTQATSIWSSRGGQLQPAPARVAASSSAHAVNGSHIPTGCWVKFGCDRGGTIRGGTIIGTRHIHAGCWVKFGCDRGGTTMSMRHIPPDAG
jgi:hypothetical protein